LVETRDFLSYGVYGVPFLFLFGFKSSLILVLNRYTDLLITTDKLVSGLIFLI